MPNKTQEYGITYKENSNLISSYTYPAGMNAYSYDCFDRLTNKIHTNLFFSGYTYVTDSQGNTSGLISSYRHTRQDLTNDLYSYTYDNLGNIKSISKNGSVIYEYAYDKLGQLICAEDIAAGYAYVYTYDTAGNITQRDRYPYYAGTTVGDYINYLASTRETDATYTYSTSAWGDMLTAYGGTSISYDRIGNPLNWRNASSMEWEGRQLDTHNFTNGDAVYYDYNSDGIRTRKLYWSDLYYTFRSHDYILDGTKIIQETVDDGITGQDYTLYYFYDESGVAGFEYDGVNYYFVKNIQGDVIEICNWDNGTVVQYTYDAWGKVLSITGTLASTVGRYNPFRYRSYYYDTETGFYYLNSRYYDPEVCRFINADGYVSTGQGILGNNMFVYCNNNPVVYVDWNGEFPVFALGLVVAGVLSCALLSSCESNDSADGLEADLAPKVPRYDTVEEAINAGFEALETEYYRQRSLGNDWEHSCNIYEYDGGYYVTQVYTDELFGSVNHYPNVGHGGKGVDVATIHTHPYGNANVFSAQDLTSAKMFQVDSYVLVVGYDGYNEHNKFYMSYNAKDCSDYVPYYPYENTNSLMYMTGGLCYATAF